MDIDQILYCLASTTAVDVLAQRLFLVSWQGGLLLAVAAIFCCKAFGLPPRIRCWIWRLAILKCLLLLCVGGVFEIAVFQPAKSTVNSSLERKPAYNASDTTSVTPEIADGSKLHHQGFVPSLAGSLNSDRAATRSKQKPDPAQHRFWHFLMMAWGAGVLVGFVRIAKLWLDARKLCRRSMPLVPTDRTAIRNHNLSRHFGLSKPPRLAVTLRCPSPVVVGMVNPTILLPKSILQQYSGRDLSMILAHEIAHVKRWDVAWNVLFALAGTLFFFHPLYWVCLIRYRMDQEMACDLAALEQTPFSPREYASVLVKCSSSGAPKPLLATAGVASSFKSLKTRLLEIEKMKTNPKFLHWLFSSAAMFVCLLMVAPIDLVAQQDQRTAIGQGNQNQTASSARVMSANTSSSKQDAKGSNVSSHDVSVSMVNNGVSESIKVTSNNYGSLDVVYSTRVPGSKKVVKRYNVQSIDELEQESPDAYAFYRRHVQSSPTGVTASATEEASDGQPTSDRYDRYRYPEKKRNPNSNSAFSSAWGSASSSSLNGRNNVRASAGTGNSGSQTGQVPNANQMLQQHVQRMLSETDNPQIRQALQNLLLQQAQQRGN